MWHMLIGYLMLMIAGSASCQTYSTNCSSAYQRISSRHSACTVASPNLQKLIMPTGHDQTIIVSYHNVIRSSVKPSAANMQTMVWDDEAALVAAGWAQTCPLLQHDKNYNRRVGRFCLGQNIYVNSKAGSWQSAIDAWSAEVNKWYYNISATTVAKNGLVVGHYTQIIWATSVKVGCAMALCKDPQWPVQMVCNYGPAGNIVDHGYPGKPYQNGTWGSSCPNTLNGNLCNCSGQVCTEQYAGTCEVQGRINPNTCKCETGTLSN